MRREFGSYIEAWHARWKREEQQRAALEERARRLVPELAQHLRVAYGASRVFLFGSLAWGGFRWGSDIDLAAEGLPAGHALYRASAELDEMAKPFRVELVALEDASDELVSKIAERGIEVM